MPSPGAFREVIAPTSDELYLQVAEEVFRDRQADLRDIRAPPDDGRAPPLPLPSESCNLMLPEPYCISGATRCISAPKEHLPDASSFSDIAADPKAIVASLERPTPLRMYRRSFVEKPATSFPDGDKDIFIPEDPAAASIFSNSAEDIPPAPSWLQMSSPARSSPSKPVSPAKQTLAARSQQAEGDVQTSGSPVVLHVYELSEWTRLSGLPIFHLGVEVFRCEYFFTREGISLCPPAHHGGHQYKEAVQLGRTKLSRREWRRALAAMKLDWPLVPMKESAAIVRILLLLYAMCWVFRIIYQPSIVAARTFTLSKCFRLRFFRRVRKWEKHSET